MRAIVPHHMRPIWAEVSAERLTKNFRVLRESIGTATELLAVVKADAYGHGAEECSPTLAAAGAKWLGVTSVEEGVRVRGALRALPDFLMPRILVMCGVWDGEAEVAVEHRLTPVVWEQYQLELLEAAAEKKGLRAGSLPVHVEIDTGMARQGVEGGAALKALVGELGKTSRLRVEGLLSHLTSSEEVLSPQNALQMERFGVGVREALRLGLKPSLVHVGNTSGVDAAVTLDALRAIAQEAGAQAMTRAGLAMYGYGLALVAGESHVRNALLPAMTWKTRVIGLREVQAGATVGYSATFVAKRAMKLALLPVGYADGLRRELSGSDEGTGGAALIRGKRAAICGRVSMDLTIVDVTEVEGGVEIGDEVVLLGEQGDAKIGAEEHAKMAETIPYEILCGISDRVPRVMVG